METYIWLGLFIVLLLIELFTVGLTTVWFAAGALIALVLASCGVSLPAQIIAFVIVSALLLVFTRPIAVKYLNGRRTKTNVDSLIGKHAKVTEAISNTDEKGAVFVDGKEWTARAASESDLIEAGAQVNVLSIEGVKLIVERVQQS
ncbi:MAG: NfeD family protein [Lachnospiraceae bacterium]|nr:NfeD family protein [Lachnospiraceae bacterium]